jgi:integrase/recombinase XerD
MNLKAIGEKLKIKKKLTCHISRHTFGNITGDKITPQMCLSVIDRALEN